MVIRTSLAHFPGGWKSTKLPPFTQCQATSPWFTIPKASLAFQPVHLLQSVNTQPCTYRSFHRGKCEGKGEVERNWLGLTKTPLSTPDTTGCEGQWVSEELGVKTVLGKQRVEMCCFNFSLCFSLYKSILIRNKLVFPPKSSLLCLRW